MPGKMQPGSRTARALTVLAEHPDGMVTTDIAKALGDYPWSQSELAARLRRQERLGNVTARKPCPGATIFWKITDRGRAVAAALSGTQPGEDENP